MNNKHVQVGVSIIIFNEENEVLIGKRKGSHGEGFWSIPGGHVEFLETYEDTCDRELLEEIGVDFSPKSIWEEFDQGVRKYEKIGFSEDFFGHYGDIENMKHYTTLYFAIKVKNDIEIKNMEPDKCEGWEWRTIYNLPNPEYFFCDSYNQIRKAFKILRN